LLVTFETYPELKANEGFLRLQASLTEVEEQISASRRFYNTAVTDYNNAVEMFPTNLMANMMNYRRKSLFEAPATERQKTNVSDLFKR
ncbi:MAG: LemA family protein, partial [Cyanobacteria bacterium P01_A01_bin.135]